MGFQVLGIEVRELNMAACNYIKSKTNLPNLRFVHDNALNIANHGLFDTVFCCGLFYHLENPKQYLETLSSVTNKLLILQTHFSIINRSDKWLRLPTTARQLTDRLLRRPAPVKFMLSAPTEHEDFPVGGLPSFPTTARLASATPQNGRPGTIAGHSGFNASTYFRPSKTSASTW